MTMVPAHHHHHQNILLYAATAATTTAYSDLMTRLPDASSCGFSYMNTNNHHHHISDISNGEANHHNTNKDNCLLLGSDHLGIITTMPDHLHLHLHPDQEQHSRASNNNNNSNSSTTLNNETSSTNTTSNKQGSPLAVQQSSSWLQLGLGDPINTTPPPPPTPHHHHHHQSRGDDDDEIQGEGGLMLDLNLATACAAGGGGGGGSTTLSSSQRRQQPQVTTTEFRVPLQRPPPQPAAFTGGGGGGYYHHYGGMSLFGSTSNHHHNQQLFTNDSQMGWGSSPSSSSSSFNLNHYGTTAASNSSISLMQPAGQPGAFLTRPLLLSPPFDTDFRLIHPPPRRPHSGIWFMLQAASLLHNNQSREPVLPQVSKRFLRIKDARMTVGVVIKYLVNKLGLDNESQVEIRCRGQVLEGSLTLQHVRDEIWSTREGGEQMALLPNTTTSEHVMVLHYGRTTNTITPPSTSPSHFMLPS